MATATKKRKPKTTDPTPYGVTVPRVYEPHAVPLPKQTRCQAWVQAGQLDDGAWLCGLEAENFASGKHTIIHPADLGPFATREEAFDFAAKELWDLADEDLWPPAAMRAIADFRATKPWVARQERHEKLVAGKSPKSKVQSPKSDSSVVGSQLSVAADNGPRTTDHGLSTTTPAGIAALDPEAEPVQSSARPVWEWKLSIDPEFEAAQRPLSDEERQRLKESLMQHGCRDPIVAWRGPTTANGRRTTANLVIDGHNRFALCQELGLPIRVVYVRLADRPAVLYWIRQNQLGRRNLSPAERDELLARDYRAEVEARKSKVQSPKSKVGARKEETPKRKAADVVAEKHGVSPATVKRAEQKLRGRERLASLTHLSLGQLAALKPAEIISLDQLDDDALREELAGGIEAWRLGRERAKLSAPEPKSKTKPEDCRNAIHRLCMKESDLRREARTHIERYLDTLAAADAWEQSAYLLEAVIQWRDTNAPCASPSTVYRLHSHSRRILKNAFTQPQKRPKSLS